MRISDWSSDVCSSDLQLVLIQLQILELIIEFVSPSRQRCAERLIRRIHEPEGDIGACLRLEVQWGTTSRQHLYWKFLSVKRGVTDAVRKRRSEEHTSELQSLMRISYAVFCLKKKKSK